MLFEIDSMIDVCEDDYKFGTGRLRMRVTAVLGELRLDDAVWARLRGVEINWAGVEACQDREALVRVSPPRRPNGRVARTGRV